MEMLCANVAPLPSYTYLVPTSLHIFPCRSHHRLKSNSVSLPKSQTHSKNISSLPLLTTSNCNHKQQDNCHTTESTSCSDPRYRHSLFAIDGNSITNQNPKAQNQEKEVKKEDKRHTRIKKPKGLFTNMWWVDMKAALGQRINVEGIVSSVAMLVKEQHLALPHVKVRDIRYIDWAELHRRGFKGVVFDKDNTITVPYTLTLWDPLGSSIEQCKSVFGNDLAVFSNSAGNFGIPFYNVILLYFLLVLFN